MATPPITTQAPPKPTEHDRAALVRALALVLIKVATKPR